MREGLLMAKNQRLQMDLDSVDPNPPGTPRTQRQLFLEPSFWEVLDGVTEFHADAHRRIGAKVLSRNDIIEHYLQMIVKAYWNDKGLTQEQSKDPELRKEALDKYVARLRKAHGLPPEEKK